jgi:hypothetical protein
MKTRPGWRVMRVASCDQSMRVDLLTGESVTDYRAYTMLFVAYGRKQWARRGEWPYHIMIPRHTEPQRKRHFMRTRRMRAALFEARSQAIVEMTAPHVLAPPTYRPIGWVNASDWGKDA